jgi:hypothetical protein
MGEALKPYAALAALFLYGLWICIRETFDSSEPEYM